MSDKKEYEVTIIVDVSANSRQEALMSALDDIRDPNLKGFWRGNVREYGSKITTTENETEAVT